MISKLVLATTNQGKVKELQSLLNDLHIHVLSLRDFPDFPPIVEDGGTFEDNALIKARTVYKATGIPTLADDSGLEVDALDGKPGVFSARYAGEHATDDQNNAKLLESLKDVSEKERTARFRSALAYFDENGVSHIFNGTCEGVISEHGSGDGGFGYDPLFYLPQYQKTMAQLSLAEKNGISHRGQAFSLFKEWLLSKR